MENINAINTQLLLGKILNTTSTCIFWKDDQRRFVGVNQAFLDYYGFASQDELIGKTDEDMGWHSDPDPFKNDEWRVLKNGESTVRVHGKCMAHGQERDILASKSPIYDNEKIVGLVGTFEDVTNDYQQKDEIRKLTETLYHIPCGICIGKINFGKLVCISANEYFTNLIGSTEDDFVGKDIDGVSAWLHPDDVGRWKKVTAEFCSGVDTTDELYRFKNKNTDDYVWLRMKGCKTRLVNDEELIYFSFTDETELKRSETRESALRELYASSIDSAKLVVWEYDIATHTVTFDSNGYTARRCKEIGLTQIFHNVPEILYQIIPQEYHTEIKRLYDDVFAGKPNTAADIVFHPSSDISPLFLHLSYTTILDNSGKPVKAYGTSQDMTKQKAAEMQYEHEVTYMNTEHKSGFIAKGHYDLTANKVLGYYKVDKFAMDVTSMTYDSVYNKMLPRIIYESDRKKYLDLFDRKKMIARFHNDDTYSTIEYRRTDGVNPVMWACMEARSFENPSTGNIECFIYAYDATEKKIQQQLSYNLHSVGYETVGLISVPQKKVTYYQLTENGAGWDERAVAVDYQPNAEEIIMKFVPEKERILVNNASKIDTVTSALDKNGSYSFSYGLYDTSGNLHRKFIHYSYFCAEKSIVFLSIQDITEQYDKEQKQIILLREAIRRGDDANRAKSDFLSRMSHDIRTPMNGIIGMTYLAKQQNSSDKVKEYLNKIDTSSKFLLGLVNDILDMSKIESGKIELHPEPYPAESFFDYVNAVIRPLCEEKGQHLILDVQPVTSVVPLIDVLRINQIFFNLFSNAVKYTPENGIITYKLRESLVGTDKVQLIGDVIDTGIGMSDELQKKAFDPFTQGERSDTSSSRGTGLGLSIVKSLIELMGGTVSVTSKLGKGSDFHLEAIFDCIPVNEYKNKSNDLISISNQISLDGKRVLLCEDHPLNQEIAKTLLENWKMIVRIADNGEIGVHEFEESNVEYYDVILMDVRMPVMDGIAATKAIRALEREDAQTVPILAMTADAFSEDVQKCLNAGMNGHVAKPIDPEKLYHTLIQILSSNKS